MYITLKFHANYNAYASCSGVVKKRLNSNGMCTHKMQGFIPAHLSDDVADDSPEKRGD